MKKNMKQNYTKLIFNFVLVKGGSYGDNYTC